MTWKHICEDRPSMEKTLEHMCLRCGAHPPLETDWEKVGPDLLAALENLSAVAQGMKILLGDKFTGTERFFEEARAAIAKAKDGKG